MKNTWRFLPLALLLCLSVASMSAQKNRITARIDGSRRFVLKGRVHPKARAENDQGPVAGSFQLPPVTLLFKTSASQQMELGKLLRQQRDPSSPNYQKWLTPEEYADQFGVSAGDVVKISDWLRSQGFVVGEPSRSRAWITFSGTAAQTRNAFHTEIHHYKVKGRDHYANATDPAIPAALSGLVAGFRGLNDFRPRSHMRKAAQPAYTLARGVHHLVPDDLAVIYNMAPLYQDGIDGTGQKIAIVGQSGVKIKDIEAFRRTFNLTAPNLQQVLVPKRPDPGVVLGDAEEAALDIEWAGAVARNAAIVYVYSDDVWQAAFYAVDQNLAPVISMSYGSCEQSDIADLPLFQAAVQQANAQGMTWLAASGDLGAADCEDSTALVAQDGLAVDVPASIPEVTAMGGTVFAEQTGSYWSANNTDNSASALSYIPEEAWNDTVPSLGLAASGGGASIIFPRPGWQTGPGVPGDSARHVPDLSLSASADHDGYYVVSGGSVQYVGGTSVAAPVMAGIVALLNHYRVSTGAQSQPGLGNINPTLYRLAQSATGVFHDIVAGGNTVPCVADSPNCADGSFGLNTGAGYDMVTGLGSVDAYNLAHQWNSAPAVNSAVVPSIDQTPVFQLPQPDASGNSWAFQITLSEEAGIGTTLTDFTIDGVSYASQIPALFGGAAIPAKGAISAAYGFQTLEAPRTMTFGFSGIDGDGAPWSTQMAAQFRGPQNLAISSLTNAASGEPAYGPGMVLTISGSELGTFAQTAGTFPLPQYLAGVQVTIDGVVAPLFNISPGKMNVQIPYETRPGMASVLVSTPYQNTTAKIPIAAAAPGIYTSADGTISPSGSGAAGQVVSLFITGEGQVRPSLATGATPSAKTPLAQLPKPRQAVTVTVGGEDAAIQFVGIKSGTVGITQIDFTIPADAQPGVQPVVVTVGGVSSPAANLVVTE